MFQVTLSMTLAATVGLAAAVGALVATLWIGVRRGDAAIAVNAVASLGAVASPLLVEYVVAGLVDAPVSFGPVLPLSIAIAGVLHMLGMLGWYDAIWWWDHVTHIVSGALVAAIIYAWVLVAGPGVLPGFAGRSAATTTIVLTMAGGVCWELIEWAARLLSDRVGVERVLKTYGRFDEVLDLVFDFVGAGLVVTFDGRLFLPLFEPVPGLTRALLAWAAGFVVVTSVLSVGIVVYGRHTWKEYR